ncbi:hypothetical protein MMA231_01432 [Asticcacaulis sp. MM231]|uniref:tetratricopeptide repeat protein n=1 Tax=Asticcacaulis sp. MM231 TaxID=3157666 RepID=UPI0032D56D7F
MKTINSCVAVLATVFGLTHPACADSWVKAQSEHFTVYSNSSSAVARQYVQRLEAYNYTLYTLYKARNAEADTTRPRFTAYLLRDRRDMRAVWPDVNENVAGFYRQCEEGSAAYATYEVAIAGGNTHLKKQKDGFLDYVLFHEYAHHFMFENYSVPLPAWYVEGFAEYFMTMDIDGKTIAIGQAESERYSRLVGEGWIDYADMLRGVRQTKSEKMLQFYAQSWLLTHYIMASPERIQIFAGYIDDINGGADPVTAFESRFDVNVTDLPKVLHDYLQKGVPVVSFTFKAMPEVAVDVTPMPKSADQLLMWNSALETCAADNLGSDLMDRIDTERLKYGNDAFSQLVEARAVILNDEPRSVRFADYQTLLSQRVAVNAQDGEAQYLLGRGYYRQAMAPDAKDMSGDMSRARSALLKAYKLDPMYAPGLYYLSRAQSNLPAYPNDAAINAAVQASNLAPSVSEYAWYAAHLLIVKDRSADAAILLTPLAANPHSAKTAARARAAINAIKAGKPKDEVLALLNASDTEDTE